MDSVWHLVRHFFEDITHYDGKLWMTVKPLLVMPGFLTLEYLRGRRASYLHPVRMFIFLNFIFFFLLLSLPAARPGMKVYTGGDVVADKALQDTVQKAYNQAQKEVNIGNVASLHFSDSTLRTSTQYDSAQAALPPGKRDGLINRLINEKALDLLAAMDKDPDYVKEKVNEIFFHQSAKLTFLFLIVCSCLLSLLYYRRHILMVEHALFSIHLSCTFLLLSVFMLLISYLPLGTYLGLAIFLYGNYYFYKALHQVYPEPVFMTILKVLVINIFLMFTMLAGILFNAMFAMMSI